MSPGSGHFGVSVGQIMMIIMMIPELGSASPGPGIVLQTLPCHRVILAKIAEINWKIRTHRLEIARLSLAFGMIHLF